MALSRRRLGRYELLLPVGVGGMATVHLARTRVMADVHRLVAIKVMHEHLRAEDGQGVAMLLDEARIAAEIRHPNVVTVEEVVDDPEGVYLVMPYVEGDTLSGLVRAESSRGGHIPFPIVARILTDALAGLHSAHELRAPDGSHRHLVHRDFTPSNLLVGTDGITRLTDFGVAKSTSLVSKTTTGHIKGKLGYMSPEQARAEPLDRRADLWAAGVVLWECLTGRRMYVGEDLAILLKITQDCAPSAQSIRSDLPGRFDELIRFALEPSLTERCPTAAAFRQRALEVFRAEGGVADTAEVADYVTNLSRRKLAERTEKLEELLRSDSSETPPIMPKLLEAPELPNEATQTGLATGTARAVKPGLGRRALGALAAAGTTGLVVGGWFLATSKTHEAGTTVTPESAILTASTAASQAPTTQSSGPDIRPLETSSAGAGGPAAQPSATSIVPAPPIIARTPPTAPTATVRRVTSTTPAKGTATGPKLGASPYR